MIFKGLAEVVWIFLKSTLRLPSAPACAEFKI
jgi:hypothetical protein